MKIQILAITVLSNLLLFTGCSVKQNNDNSSLRKIVPQEKIIKVDSLYEKERKAFLSQIMYFPKIPVKTPDKILRVLVMPYVDEEMNLQTENFHFVKVDEGRWILGEYLNGQDRQSNPKTLTPLK
jgi:hypothetical protein